MGVYHFNSDWPLFAGPPECRQVPKVYTPSMDGFERFVRESVGLDSAMPGDGEDGDERPQRPHEGRRTT
jgi:hypothetical protein